jgi:hypothetical protein
MVYTGTAPVVLRDTLLKISGNAWNHSNVYTDGYSGDGLSIRDATIISSTNWSMGPVFPPVIPSTLDYTNPFPQGDTMPTPTQSGRGLYQVFIINPKTGEILLSNYYTVASSAKSAELKAFRDIDPPFDNDTDYDDFDIHTDFIMPVRNKKDLADN